MKKYQIFVSSTYEDLKEERDQVIKAILEMGHIPVGMEMFSAADDEQWKIIQKHIDEVDYYVVLIAHNYGSVTDNGISYTEKEYDYAVKMGIPVFGFIIHSDADWSANKMEQNPNKIESLNNFKDKVKTKTVSFWNNKQDLYGSVSIALMKAFNTYERPGWTRSNESVGPDTMLELTRLSKENALLRKKLEETKGEVEQQTENEIYEVIKILKSNKTEIYLWNKTEDNWKSVGESNLYKIFNKIAPELIDECSIKQIARLIALGYDDVNLRKRFPVPSNHISSWLADLVSLELIKPSEKKHSVKDTNEYWTLSEKGHKIFTKFRRFNLESSVSEEKDTIKE